LHVQPFGWRPLPRSKWSGTTSTAFVGEVPSTDGGDLQQSRTSASSAIKAPFPIWAVEFKWPFFVLASRVRPTFLKHWPDIAAARAAMVGGVIGLAIPYLFWDGFFAPSVLIRRTAVKACSPSSCSGLPAACSLAWGCGWVPCCSSRLGHVLSPTQCCPKSEPSVLICWGK
jgi:hypothetical protein